MKYFKMSSRDMCHASRLLLALTTTLLCIALAGCVSSLLGTSWMEVHSFRGSIQIKTVEIGLIRSCDEWWNFPRNVTCALNIDLFKFDLRKEWDISAVLLIVASSFLMVAVISVLSMSCCQRKKKRWLYGAITTSICTFFGAIISLTALIYFEIEWYGRIHVVNYDRGWSNIVGWASSGIGLGTFAFSCSLSCVKPSRNNSSSHGSHSSPVESSYPMTNYGNRNLAYQERSDWDKNQSYNGVIKEFYATQASM